MPTEPKARQPAWSAKRDGGGMPPKRVFGYFLHEQKATPPQGGYKGQLGSHRRKYWAYHVGTYSPMSSG